MAETIITVFEIRVDFDETTTLLIDEKSPEYVDYHSLEKNSTTRLSTAWIPQSYREMQPGMEGYDGQVKVADIVNLNNSGRGFAIRGRALPQIKSIIETFGELLPAWYIDNFEHKEELWWFRPLVKKIDAIDDANTIGIRAPNGFWSHVSRFALHESKLIHGIFHLNTPFLFCSDSIKLQFEEAGATGLYFLPVWSTDPTIREKIMAWERKVGYQLPPM